MLNFPTQVCKEFASHMDLFDRPPPNKLSTFIPLKLFQQLAVDGEFTDAVHIFRVAFTNDLAAAYLRANDRRMTSLPRTSEAATALSTTQTKLDPPYKPLLSSYPKDAQGLITLSEGDTHYLKIIFGMTKSELLGVAIESVVQVLSESTAAKKDKLAASAIIEQVFGIRDASEASALTDKLIVNLIKTEGK